MLVMVMQILECRSIRKKEILKLKSAVSKSVTLVVIQIGAFKENDVYLESKKKLALELGIELIEYRYDEDSTKEEIINKILELNFDKNVAGIMIQKPILKNFDYQELVNYIDYKKDVDGVNKINQERLKDKKECIISCTARAVLKVFDEYKISLENRKIVIVGKSDLVGMPLYNVLKRKNEVVLCDSKTVNLKDKIKESEIIISAIGKANYFDDSYFKEGQIIIDVGINYLDGKLVGDVDFNSLMYDVSITPVPGGVGQLTPVYLFWNLVDIGLINDIE